MIKVQDFYSELLKNDITFFAGVPDSLLKDICAYITSHAPREKNIITANEGGAIALGAGYYLATNKIPLIYMQNSGIGNAVNPLLSLADKDVYSIPMILLIGWRGEPQTKDEPQHVKQGRVTPELLKSMEIPFQIMDGKSDYEEIIINSVKKAKEILAPVAILVRKNTFDSFLLNQSENNSYELSREKALEEVLQFIPKSSVIVSSTGMLSRELFELREKYKQSHKTDFLTVGSMGHTSQIALGIALGKPSKQVFCFDGDGSAIMHLGNYAITGSISPKNLKIIIFNNGAHDSVGGQPTVGQWIDFPKIADAMHIKNFGSIQTQQEIKDTLPEFINFPSIALLDIRIKKGARKDLGRPTSTPLQNKELFQTFLQK
jgi:phosphonopyruvate decarboxylase